MLSSIGRVLILDAIMFGEKQIDKEGGAQVPLAPLLFCV